MAVTLKGRVFYIRIYFNAVCSERANFSEECRDPSEVLSYNPAEHVLYMDLLGKKLNASQNIILEIPNTAVQIFAT
jgi:hypothetical protein